MTFRGLCILLALCVLLMSDRTAAQEKGSLVGVVRDAKTGEGLPSVNVKIVGTYYGAATDFDGNYRILNIAAGSYTLQFFIIRLPTTPPPRPAVRQYSSHLRPPSL